MYTASISSPNIGMLDPTMLRSNAEAQAKPQLPHDFRSRGLLTAVALGSGREALCELVVGKPQHGHAGAACCSGTS